MKRPDHISVGPADRPLRPEAGAPPDWDPLQACLGYLHKLRRERRPAPASVIDLNDGRLAAFATRVAEWAQAGTRAAGAVLALAMPGGDIVCIGRSGIAPELGARLDRSSGVSGQCVRTGEPYLCRDTAGDPWADPQACADMGIRSLAMLALRRQGAVIGLLGVFSNREAHFDPHHLGTLRYLEGVVAEELERIAQS